MWRDAMPADDEAVVSLCLALNAEDEGQQPVSGVQVERTLRTLRAEPWRGKTVVLDVDGVVAGYAFLISFWSNELGGEVCTVDELYVVPTERSQGHARALFADLERLWGRPFAAAGLETSPANERAKAYYRSLGFDGDNTAMVRRVRA